MNEVFTFVGASQLTAKANLWKEHDKAIKDKYEKLNNETLSKATYDKDAKISCKGKDQYWYGYKRHLSIDIYNKVAVTSANEETLEISY